MPPGEFARAVSECILARNHGLAFEMAAQVFAKLLDRVVAARRFLAQCHQHDVVEIAGELPAPFGWRFRLGADCGARLGDFRFANRALDLSRRVSLETMRTLA